MQSSWKRCLQFGSSLTLTFSSKSPMQIEHESYYWWTTFEYSMIGILLRMIALSSSFKCRMLPPSILICLNTSLIYWIWRVILLRASWLNLIFSLSRLFQSPFLLMLICLWGRFGSSNSWIASFSNIGKSFITSGTFSTSLLGLIGSITPSAKVWDSKMDL